MAFDLEALERAAAAKAAVYEAPYALVTVSAHEMLEVVAELREAREWMMLVGKGLEE